MKRVDSILIEVRFDVLNGAFTSADTVEDRA